MSDILETRNLIFKGFLKYPDIHIKSGEVTFLQGPSGSGKSTLLRLLNGILSPDSGFILYENENIEHMNTIILRRQVLLAGQQVFLFSGTIEHNFNEFYKYREMPILTRTEMNGYLSLCCGTFQLETECGNLSGGERQRVYLAICLSFNPKVLLLDEPTSALDVKLAHEVMGNIKAYGHEHKLTMLVISHDEALVKKYADNIITLKGLADNERYSENKCHSV